MRTDATTISCLICVATVLLLSGIANAADKLPLKVYILAGQSNMEGHAKVSTFPHIGMDPKTKPLLDMMQDKDGNPRVCDRVWISYLTSKKGERVVKEGKLTAGFGSQEKGPKIGPEFTFGLSLQSRMENPILLIKTAWGGQSLYRDFRSPSAGPFVPNDFILKSWNNGGKNVQEMTAKGQEGLGSKYQEMIAHVKDVLANIKRVCPDYDPEQGYEIAGFVWFQGWNDKVNSYFYPNREQPGGYDYYSALLADFIRDVRKDVNAPNMPFVIGVVGQGGPIDIEHPRDKNAGKNYYFRLAQAAPAALPEFKGNVRVVLTEQYWDSELGNLAMKAEELKAYKNKLSADKNLTREQVDAAAEEQRKKLFTDKEWEIYELGISNFEFHYYGSAKMFAEFGRAFAEALLPSSEQ